jgi:glycine hydroxymethyltransferase
MEDRIFSIIAKEKKRQREQLVLIPSENYASGDVMRAVGSVLMNKYSEGQVGKRYYQGNEYVDEVESLCKERALKLFGLDGVEWGVNVQAYSGSPANLAVYVALLEPGERMLSMHLTHGGHLSHGWHFPQRPVSFTSKIWEAEFYGVNRKTQLLDYGQIESQAKKFKPKMIISGGTAYPREINHKRMGEIARRVGAYYLADIAHEAGLIAAGVNKSPFPHADVVTMTTHKTLRGPRGAIVISRKEIAPKIDYAVFPGLQGGPHNHTIAGIAVCLAEAQRKSFMGYVKQVVKNAQSLADELTKAGFKLIGGGTDKHLVLVDLRSKGVSGWVVAWALEQANIIVNRNTVPFDTVSAYYPSGIRLGTPAVTTRGMKEKEMRKIGGLILDVVDYAKKWQLPNDREKRALFIRDFEKKLKGDRYLVKIGHEVKQLTRRFPVPGR